VIDTKAIFATGISMRTTAASVSSYISRVVSIDSTVSNGLAVFVDENTPSKSVLAIYYRVASAGTSDILSKTWTAMTRTSTAPVSGSDLDYSEGTYGATLSSPFSSYQIKITLSSSATNPTYYQTPAVRSLRVASFVS